MNIYKHIKFASLFAAGAALTACGAEGDDTGYEFAPNMYHSVPYEPLSQITDEEEGTLTEMFDRNSDGHGEYYNSNPLNPHRMTMRVPPANTVPRGAYLPYRIHKDSLEQAAKLKSPLPENDEVLTSGRLLYDRFCDHCHGGAGQGDGLVAEVYPGVANLTGAAYQNLTEGHIFHVITHGKGLMQPHGSQIKPEDRWKIARYVKQLQGQ